MFPLSAADFCLECGRLIIRGSRHNTHQARGLCRACYERHSRRLDTPWAIAAAAKRRAAQLAFVQDGLP